MKFKLPVLFLAMCIAATVLADYPSFKPMLAKSPLVGYSAPGWPPKLGSSGASPASAALAAAALKQYMVQLRSGTRLSPVAVRPSSAMLMSLKRPVKSVYSPTYSFLKQPMIKRPILSASAHSPFVLNLNLKPKFQSSPPGPKTGEIVYEKLKPLVSQSRLPSSSKDGAIHTIPAPNLANVKASSKPAVHQLQISTFDDNNHLEIDIHKTTKPGYSNHQQQQQSSTFATQPTFASYSTPQPVQFHRPPYPPAAPPTHYQVTEEHSNDVTLKNPYSGMKTYFAPDPDPSLPSKTLMPTSDPLSEPSNGRYPPNDLLLQAQTQQAQNHHYLTPSSQTPKPFYDVNAAPQGYAIPLASQPQLQQHILQQTSMLQGMPLSLYNPTYLVTQSNNLYNNHQHQLQSNLFKPESSFLGAVQSPQVSQPPNNVLYNSYTYKHAEPAAASQGQILAATQDQLQELQSAVSQIQLNDLQQQHSHETPTYAQLVGHEQLALHQQQIPQLNQLEQQLQQQLIQQHEKANQHQLTEGEIANLLNFGTINLHDQLSPNDYYHYQIDQEQQQQQQQNQQYHHQQQQQQQQQQQSFYELSERQKENDRILAQAQQDLYQQQQQQQQPYQYNTETPQPQQSTASSEEYLYAYQQHQQAVANALAHGNGDSQNSKRDTADPAESTPEGPLRIFVPDTESEYPNSVTAQRRMDELNYDYADDEEAAQLYNTEPSTSAEQYGDINRADVDVESDERGEGEEEQQQGSTVDDPTDAEDLYRQYSNHRLN